jgi:Protein of unknown function (DUF3592)
MENIPKTLIILIFIVLTLLGIIFFAMGINKNIEFNNARNWPKIEAFIESQKVVEIKSKLGISYCPQWTYSYSVNGVQYMSSKSAFGDSKCTGWIKLAKKELDKKPIGTKVFAIYDPKNPKNAALKILNENSSDSMLIFLGISLITLVFVLYKLSKL